MNPRIKALQTEFDKVRSGIETIQTKAANEGRDLTDAEQADVDTLFKRAEDLRPVIETEAEKVRGLQSTAEVLARIGLSAPATITTAKPERPLPSVGEYITNYNRSLRGDAEAAEFVRSFQAEFARAAAQQGLSDNTGLVPTPILGDLIKFVDPARPALNSLTQRPMWTGTGYRPRVTQSTSVAVQAAEFSELASQKMAITKDALTRATYGGYVEISEQDAEFTDPGAMQIIMEDLAQQYGVTTGNVVADALVAAATNTYELTGAAGAISTVANADLIKGLWSGANQVYTQCKKLPDTLWLAPNVWADFGGRTDTAGRPLFPQLGVQNSTGTLDGVGAWAGSPLAGIRMVVDPNFANDVMIIGRSQYGEVYEQIKGTAIGAFNVGTLATQVGYRGYLGTYFRAEGFVKFVNAA